MSFYEGSATSLPFSCPLFLYYYLPAFSTSLLSLCDNRENTTTIRAVPQMYTNNSAHDEHHLDSNIPSRLQHLISSDTINEATSGRACLGHLRQKNWKPFQTDVFLQYLLEKPFITWGSRKLPRDSIPRLRRD